MKFTLAALALFIATAAPATAGTIFVTGLPSTPCSCSWVLRLVKVPIVPPPTFEETGPRVEPPVQHLEDDGQTHGGEPVPVPEPRPEEWHPWWAVHVVPKPPVDLYQWVWMWVCTTEEEGPPHLIDIDQPPMQEPVPEPGMALLVGLGVLGFVWFYSRR